MSRTSPKVCLVIPAPVVVRTGPVPTDGPDYLGKALPAGVEEGALPTGGATMREFSIAVDPRITTMVPRVCLGTFLLTPFSSYVHREVGTAIVVITVLTASRN